VVRVAGPTIRELAERFDVRPARSLGQNFLVDPNLARAIVADAGVGSGDHVVEVGAGLGSLTIALADAGAAEVLAIEFDRRLLPALEEAVRDRPSVRVLHADATKLDWASSLRGDTWTLVANLPYNVGTTIVIDVLEHAPAVRRLVVMLQREVGERLAAGPGEDAYGAASIKVAARADARLIRRVPPEVFWPRPSVGSVIVLIDRLDPPPAWVDDPRVWRVIDVAFAQRRKTMRNAVRRLGLDADAADAVLSAAGVSRSARAEELGPEDFVRIAERVSA
jgi:16S rRNA (adenine1518-N6/adenine1519-N6)-dimethyltransferase